MIQQFQCPACGEVCIMGDPACRVCGEYFTYNCPSCSYFVNKGNNRCPNCGTQLYWGSPPVKTTGSQSNTIGTDPNIPAERLSKKTGSLPKQDAKKSKRLQYVLWLVLALLCVILIGVILFIDRILNIQ